MNKQNHKVYRDSRPRRQVESCIANEIHIRVISQIEGKDLQAVGLVIGGAVYVIESPEEASDIMRCIRNAAAAAWSNDGI